MDYQPSRPKLEPLFQATVTVAAPTYISQVPLGERRFIPITGGSFTGEKLSGDVLPGGEDWQLVRPDGSALLHARYTLQANDGALIYVENKGIRRGSPEVLARMARGDLVDPSEYYFRTTPRFETGAPQYAWLNSVVAVCSGMRLLDTVIIDFYSVL